MKVMGELGNDYYVRNSFWNKFGDIVLEKMNVM